METIQSKFILSKKHLASVLNKLNGFLYQNHIILFQTAYLLEFAETLINHIKDSELSDEEGFFSSKKIDVHKLGLDEVQVMAVL